MIDWQKKRSLFPALSRKVNGQPVAYFDGPAGSQVPQQVIDAVSGYLAHHNANRGACFDSSRETDDMFEAAGQSVADFLGTDDPGEIVFGPNMTTLTLGLSRVLGRTWKPEDEIIVTRLDHDANVTPWVLAAREAGAKVHHIDLHLEDCTLDLESFEAVLSERTKLLAVGYASNATGTINPVRQMVSAARSVGAMTFVDAVHYAPHGLIDVKDLGCDFLACSAYKFFGPHVGILWGRREHLEFLVPYKLRPSPESLPDRWMTGTQNHEGIAGVNAAIAYLAELASSDLQDSPRRDALRDAYDATASHEQRLLEPLIDYLRQHAEIRIWGITDPERMHERVPTVSITHQRYTPRELAEHFARMALWTWTGNHYALPFTEAAGLEPQGTLRVGLLHYNTSEEVQRLIDAIETLPA